YRVTPAEADEKAMKVGLIGLRGSGKTTVFNMLTGLEVKVGEFRGDKDEVHLGVIKVPDLRVDRLAAIFKPKKTTYAEIQFADFPPQAKESPTTGATLLSQMREVEAIALVLKGFESDSKPLKDLDELLTEMVLADLAVVENRLNRLKKEKGKEGEGRILQRCQETLEKGTSLRPLSFTPDEENLLSGFGFLSRKPALALFNVNDEQAGKDLPAEYAHEIEERGIEGFAVAGKLEMEIAQLNEADREAFLQEAGLKETARARFIRACYHLLDLISFFTTGEDEVKAWTIRRGTPARKAAGKIHSDIERGFIRAEVVTYEDFITLGSEVKCKEAGKLRLEGKDYTVQDGDIIHYRFNV
ncbi:MAG: redox-regulated ATPase YchF, partial [Candidatus Binatia bacterium]